MTEQQLAEIEARWAKATPGPWFSEYGEQQANPEEPPSWNGEMYITGKQGTAQYDQSSYIATVGYNGSGESDAAAIANAPTDISALLAEVRRLNAENAEQKKVIDATVLYMKHINSLLCLGWDNLLDAMQGYRKYLESEVADNG